MNGGSKIKNEELRSPSKMKNETWKNASNMKQTKVQKSLKDSKVQKFKKSMIESIPNLDSNFYGAPSLCNERFLLELCVWTWVGLRKSFFGLIAALLELLRNSFIMRGACSSSSEQA